MGVTTTSQRKAQDGLKAFHDEEPLRTSNDIALLRRIGAFLRPHRVLFWIALAGIVLSAGITIVQPLIMGRVSDVAQRADLHALWRNGALLATVMLLSQLVNLGHTLALQTLGIRFVSDLRAAVFGHVHRLRLGFLDQTPTGRWVTRVTSDTETLGEIFSSGVIQSLGDVLALIGIVIAMLWLDLRLALVTFATFPLVAFLVLVVSRRAKQIYRTLRIRTARLNSFFSEQAQGIAIVQAFGKEHAMQEEFRPINEAHRTASQHAVLYESVLDAAIELLTTLCIASLLWWMGYQRLGTNPASFGLVVTFVQFVRRFFEPISALAQRFTLLQNALSGAERVFSLLDQPDTEPAYADQTSLAPVHNAPAVVFDNVSFAYRSGHSVLSNVSFSVSPGETIALVGATGAGKTTVTSLLLRLYERSAGTIRVLGNPIEQYTLEQLRSLFSVVPQDVLLFPGTWLSNIALGDPSPDPARARGALLQLGQADWLRNSPAGLDTPIEERGANLSVGERQCIALARALYRNAPLVILDEATASIDSSTEATLQQAWTTALRGRTVLIIAHRLSTIQHADRVLVFHKGQLVESGPHAQLITQDGLYRRLYKMQANLSFHEV